MQMDIYVSAAIMRIFGNGVWSVCEYVCLQQMWVLWQSVASGACAILSSTGKLPVRRENNAHKRLSEEASGADVFHMALNGATAKCVCVCVHVVYMLMRETEEEKKEKHPLEYVCRQRQEKIVCVHILVMCTETCALVCL